jgi:uncharacterized protein
MDQNENMSKPKRGFAAMSPERQREIARKGGESVPAENRSFSRNRELAATAGRKGGEASHGHRPMREESSAANDASVDQANDPSAVNEMPSQKFDT